MANEKYLMTISMEKWRKCTSQMFDFWNCIAQIFANKLRDFQKWWIYEKIWKLPILKAIFWSYMVENDKQQLFYDNQHGKMKKIYIIHLRFFSLETLSQRFVLNILRDFWNASNYEKYQNLNFFKTFFEQIQLDMANEKIL